MARFAVVKLEGNWAEDPELMIIGTEGPEAANLIFDIICPNVGRDLKRACQIVDALNKDERDKELNKEQAEMIRQQILESEGFTA